MKTKLLAAKKIFRREGFFALVKETIKHCVFIFFFLPLFFLKIKVLKFKNLGEMLDFIYKTSLGYFAPMQVRSEIDSLLKYIECAKPKIVMEIGTAAGGTLFCITKIASFDSLIISLDMPRRRKDYPWWKVRLYESFALNKQKIRLIRKDSHKPETLQEIKNILGNKKIDFLFIDGDHSYEGVKNDFEMYGRLVRKGGAMAFHDVVRHPLEVHCGAHKFWNEIKTLYDHKEFIENENQNWAGIGLIEYN